MDPNDLDGGFFDPAKDFDPADVAEPGSGDWTEGGWAEEELDAALSQLKGNSTGASRYGEL